MHHANGHTVPVVPAPVVPMVSPIVAQPQAASASIAVVGEPSLLTEVEWLDPRYAEQLREMGVQTVAQFLDLEPEDAQHYLSAFSVPAQLIFRWQSELSLQCYVGLTGNDAALLVACGVDDPEELAYIDVSELHRRIGQYLDSSDSRNQFGSLARYERSRLSRWIQTARNSHYRRQRHRWDRYRNDRANGGERMRPARPRPESRRPESRRREVRQTETRRMVRTPQSPIPTRNETPPPSSKGETVRFYLEPSDPVVDAPSIGPKTAERFHAIGVTTVQQLLELDPTTAAKKIGYRRITAELIKTWQLQTTLVCRVPGLRGHDAQILVACDVPTAEALAKMSADSLLTEVTRFCKTAEGKRVIRSSKAPDLDEVTRWIQWAQQSRSLTLAVA